MKRGPQCDTLFERWWQACIEKWGKETMAEYDMNELYWAFREGFKARAERDRKTKESM